jgi:hypothetical protein
MPKKNLIDCLGAPHDPYFFFFPYFALKTPETSVVRAGTAGKRRRPYRTTFPNRETSYGTADDVSGRTVPSECLKDQ